MLFFVCRLRTPRRCHAVGKNVLCPCTATFQNVKDCWCLWSKD